MKIKHYFIAFASMAFLGACTKTEFKLDPSAESDNTVAIELLSSENTKTEVSALFTPAEEVTKYEFAIGTRDDLENFTAGSLETVTVEGNEPAEHVFDNLNEGTPYTLFARAYIGDQAGPVASAIAHTLADELTIEESFTGSQSAAYKIIPTSVIKGISYELRTAPDGGGDAIDSYSREDISVPWTATFFDLTPSTTYYLTVKSEDRYGNRLEDRVKTFTTKALDDAPGLNVTKNIDDFWITEFTLTPNDNTARFMLYYVEKGALDNNSITVQAWQGNYIEVLSEQLYYSTPRPTFTDATTQQYVNQHQSLLVSYELYVLLFDSNDEFFGASRIGWTTPDYDESAGVAEVGVSVQPTDKGAVYTFEPNDDTVGFYYETFLAATIDGTDQFDPGAKDEAWVTQWFQDNAIYLQVPTDVRSAQWSYRYLPPSFGYWQLSWTDDSAADPELFPSGTEFIIYVMPLNKNGLYDGVGTLTSQRYNKL